MRATFLTRSLVLVSLAGAPLAARAAGPASELELPRIVPGAKLTQQVGLTEISIEYDCAAVRGRKIWGGLVPYDHPWTIGANPAAKLRFTKDVTIGDKLVPAGTYWLLATPGKTSWTFMINKSADVVATAADYKPDLDVARVKVAVKPAPHRERITFLFSDLSDERASLDLEWDNVRASLPIAANTKQQIEAAIGGLDDTWRAFANAARYMLETKKDYDAGLRYIDQSLALQALEHKQDWYSLWIKGALYAAKGDFVQAHDLAQNAYDLAKQSGGSFYLEPDLAKAIVDWGKRRPFEKERSTPVAAHVDPPYGPTEPPPSTTPPPLGQTHTLTQTQPQSPVTAADDGSDNTMDATGLSLRSGASSKSNDAAGPALEKSAPLGDPPLRRARLRKR
jgi:Protein of unknown function (DUF2911)